MFTAQLGVAVAAWGSHALTWRGDFYLGLSRLCYRFSAVDCFLDFVCVNLDSAHRLLRALSCFLLERSLSPLYCYLEFVVVF